MKYKSILFKTISILAFICLTSNVLASQYAFHCPDKRYFSEDITLIPYGYPKTTGYYYKSKVGDRPFSSIAYYPKPTISPNSLTLNKVTAVGEAVNCTYDQVINSKQIYMSNFGDILGKITWINPNIKGNSCSLEQDKEYHCAFYVA